MQRILSVVALFLIALLCLAGSVASAADSEFVGVLALAAEDDVAQQLGLSDEIKQQLQKVIDDRINESVDFVLEIKDLPYAERMAKLAPFIAESEKRGLALLTDEQRTKLGQIRIAKMGLAGLADEVIATKVGLSDEQKAEVSKLVTEYHSVMSQASQQQKQIARAFYERKLAAVLSTEQRIEWDKLAGAAGGAPPAGSDQTAVAGDTSTTKGEKLRFNFRYAPWKEVLDWFATQADLSFSTDEWPQGTFNYSDNRSYTPEQALDLINSVLLTKGYTLVRRERMLMLFNLENGPVSPAWVPVIDVKDLDSKGEFELVSVLFQLNKMIPEEAEKEANKLKGPLGTVVVLTPAKQLFVTETVGKLKAIRRMIEAVETPTTPNEPVTVIKLKSVLPSEFLAMVRQLFGIPENQFATPDGSLRLAIDEIGGKVIVSGKAAAVERVQDLVKQVDAIDESQSVGTPLEQPQLVIYPVTNADPLTALQVLQTLLAGYPDVRLTSDTKTGNIVALAKPSQHATIRATLDEMQGTGSAVEVIKLRRMDPQAAVLAINKLFGESAPQSNSRDSRAPAPSGNAPRVDADPINMLLFIRGTPNQVAQIKEFLKKVGEGGEEDPLLASQRTNVRILPLTGRGARNALSQAEMVWPTMRTNKIRVVTPSGTSSPPTDEGRDFTQPPVYDQPPAESAGPFDLRDLFDLPAGVPDPNQTAEPDAAVRERTLPRDPQRNRPAPRVAPAEEPAADQEPTKEPAAEPQPAPKTTPTAAPAEAQPVNINPDGTIEAIPPRKRSAAKANGNKAALKTVPQSYYFVAFGQPAEEASQESGDRSQESADASQPSRSDDPMVAGGFQPPEEAVPEQRSVPGADIVITQGPGGIVIASEDLDALDEFETLLRSLGETSAVGGKEFTIYYLKYAKAETAASLLQETLSGGASTSSGEGGSLMGDIAASMMGDIGGGMLGNLLGGGGAGGSNTTTVVGGGAVSITPDPRLNALYVSALPRDLDTIEQLLEVIDKPGGPEPIETTPQPQFIPILNANAQDVANVVKQVYATRIQSEGGGQSRQPSPEDFIRALTRGRGGSNNQRNRGEEPKMTIGVDTRSNSLIVAAPDYLFAEVKALVETLDTADIGKDETVRVVTLKRTNSDTVSKSLQSMLGSSVTVNRSGTTSTTPGSRTGSTSSFTPGGSSSGSPFGGDRPSQESMDQMRQRMEMFNALQRFGGGDRGGGDRGGGFPGGFSGGDRGGSPRMFMAPGGGFPGGGFPSGGFPGGGDFRSRGGDGDRGGSDRGRDRGR